MLLLTNNLACVILNCSDRGIYTCFKTGSLFKTFAVAIGFSLGECTRTLSCLPHHPAILDTSRFSAPKLDLICSSVPSNFALSVFFYDQNDKFLCSGGVLHHNTFIKENIV